MTLLLGTSLKVKLRYVFLRGGTYYYQRRIPKDLLHRYDGKVFKVNLNTLDPQQVIRKVEALNSKLEAEWRAMRDDSSLTAVQAREAAKALLRQYQLNPFPADNPDYLLSPFLDDLERKRVKHAKGDEDRYDDPIEDYLKPTEVAAIQLLNSKPEMS